MNKDSFLLKTIILKSNNNNYIEGKNKKINIKGKIGEGKYGIVYLLDNQHVIKIFKNSTTTNTILNESNYLIPITNENRELIFYYQYKNDNNYIINLYAIGVIKDKFIDNNININSYFIILPYCIPFYDIYKFTNEPLISNKSGIEFTVNVMKRLTQISKFLETKYEYIYLDFKLNNFMFSKKSFDLEDLVMIDFSIIKKKIKNKKYTINRQYYVWPKGDNIILENIPAYSISINGLELLFGYNKLYDFPNEYKINIFLKFIKSKNEDLYNIFYNCIKLNINTDTLLKMINIFIRK
jgi:hypothetical protein